MIKEDMSEELQRYLKKEETRRLYRGDSLDDYEHYILGSTTLNQLKQTGIIDGFIIDITFIPKIWRGKSTSQNKPDEIVLDNKSVILVVERKQSNELRTPKQEEEASEQCLVAMQQLNAKFGVITDYNKFLWISNPENKATEVRYIYDLEELFSQDYRQKGIIKKVIADFDSTSDSIRYTPAVDPSSLADKVWQTIWLATHEEPKLCLSTFVEFFLYKFLSDLEVLPANLRIDKLNMESTKFINNEGITQIEFYCQKIRPVMKSLFPEGANFKPPISNFKYGSDTTSIIDGFAFLESGIATHNHPLQTFNPQFMSIIKLFIEFGKLIKIDSEFKSKVYEKFLKKNAKQKKLGQYLTPRTVVRAIVGMANPKKFIRQKDKSICDPACGVGGFLLEPLLQENWLKNNLIIEDNKICWKIELVGMEVDRQTNILSKANMLIHLAETYKELTKKQKQLFVDFMNKTFLLTDHTKVLGSLKFPQKDRFDLILTNPPFTVRGTRVIKEQIAESQELKELYNQAGIGTESLFLRWIINALRPNGQAFVIVPTGILTRMETNVRQYLLQNCILDGIISLPENTFYNTSNPTYILCFTKREKAISRIEQPDEDVFAYLIREIGESRDVLRLPCQNDLKDLIRQFRVFYSDKEIFESRNLNCKMINKKKLNIKDRWDIDRFWTDEEKIRLGLSESKTINISQLESKLISTAETIRTDLEVLRNGNGREIDYKEISLSDENYFKIERGKRITKKQINSHPGKIPVISSSGQENVYLGFISKKWLEDNKNPLYTEPLITINADGSVGDVFMRRESEYTIIDVVNIIKIINEKLDQDYIMYAIKEAIAKAGFTYQAKLYIKRLKTLNIRVPINKKKELDLDLQKQLAQKYEKLAEIKKVLKKFSKEIEEKFIEI